MTIQEEINAIEIQIAKAESDSHTWQVAEDEERYLESYNLVAALELQLEDLLRLTRPASDHYPHTKIARMLNNFSHLIGSTVTASDDTIGHVTAAFFDDQSWTIRYLVVQTGPWLFEREVLISPYSVKHPLQLGKNINVTLTRKQVEDSPDIDTHQPVSRQHEREYLSYYSYPEYWVGDGMWGMSAYPLMSPNLPTPEQIAADDAIQQRALRFQDVHLRNSAKVTGYDIQAIDESIGHIKDFIFDEQSWTIRYLVVDTRNWWPGGRKVLIATHWIDTIDWDTRTVHVKLTREQVKNSPTYNAAEPIARAYELSLHNAYNRQGYW